MHRTRGVSSKCKSSFDALTQQEDLLLRVGTEFKVSAKGRGIQMQLYRSLEESNSNSRN